MTSRPRILFFTTQVVHPYWGGSEKYWFETILDGQFRERFACAALIPDSPIMRDKGRQLEQFGAAVGYYSFPIGKPPLARRVIRRLNRAVTGHHALWETEQWNTWLDRYRPELVWFNVAAAHHLLDLHAAATVCHARGVPYWVVVQHCFQDLFWFDEAAVTKSTFVADHAARVVFVSDTNRRSVERALARKLTNAWRTVNAVSHEFLEKAAALAREHPVHTTGKARLFNLARFSPEAKGQHLLLEVLSDPVWRDRDWSLTLQGGGPLQGYMRRLVEFHGLNSSRVFVTDHSDAVFLALANADLLVMPSLSEGMPFAMIEAMACGRAAVGTPVAGIDELIVENETGWLSQSTRTADVADALERAWRDRARWPEFGLEAQARILARFDRQTTMPEVIGALEEDLARRARRVLGKMT